MSPLFQRSDRCRMCSDTSLDRVVSLPPTPLANAFVAGDDVGEPQVTYPLDLHRCRGCGHVQLRDLVDPLAVFQRRRTASADVAAVYQRVRTRAGDILTEIQPRHGSLVVVLGSNDGTVPAVFQEAELRVFGVEPAVDLARAAIAAGVDTFPGFFSPAIAARIEEQSGRAALVVAGNALVHARDPQGFLEGVQLLLARDGVFAFEVPYLPDIAEHLLVDAIRHDVLDHYTLAPLVNMLHACDLEVISATAAPLGRLRGYAQYLGGPRPHDGSVERLLEREARGAPVLAGHIETLARRVQALKEALADVLCEGRRNGRRFAGFGAPATATTLMYALGLDAEALDFIVDDCTWKQGLRTPGLHVPILSPNALYSEKPDDVVLLSWDFADAIVERHAAFCASGGRFIVPLPELKIISGTVERSPSGQ